MKDLDYLPDQLQPDELVLPKWVKVTKNRFNGIGSIITEVKKNKSKTIVDGKEFTLDNAESLLKVISNGKINGC